MTTPLEPTAELRGYDPERWARWWTLGLSLWILGTWAAVPYRTQSTGWRWAWQQHGLSPEGWLTTNLPVLVGVALFASMHSLIGTARKAVLLLVALAPTLESLLHVLRRTHTSGSGITSLYMSGAVLLASGVATGNHLRRHHPESEGARRLAGYAGLALACLALKYTWLELGFWYRMRDRSGTWQGQSVLVGATLLYGLAGFSSLARFGGLGPRVRLLSWLGRGIVLLGPAAYVLTCEIAAHETSVIPTVAIHPPVWHRAAIEALEYSRSVAVWVVAPALALTVWIESCLRAEPGLEGPGFVRRSFLGTSVGELEPTETPQEGPTPETESGSPE